jgi:hypothetical protein
MKKCVALLALMLSVISCNTSDVENENPVALNDSQLKTERVFFKDWENFGKEYAKISKLSNEEIFGENELMSIIQNDESRENLSPALNKFLNKNNEFQVGNEIMWYKDGDFYSFNIIEEKELNNLKLNYKDITVSEKIVNTKISQPKLNDNGFNKRVFLNPNGGIDARYQYQFRRQAYYDCGSTINEGRPTRDQKYVNELYAERVSSGPNYLCSLYLRVKLEWNASGGKWRFAGEKRTIVVNLSGQTSLTTVTGAIIPYTSSGVNVNQTFNCSQNQTILLSGFAFGAVAPGSWVVDITGTIYQKINGDFDGNAWTNNVNW